MPEIKNIKKSQPPLLAFLKKNLSLSRGLFCGSRDEEGEGLRASQYFRALSRHFQLLALRVNKTWLFNETLRLSFLHLDFLLLFVDILIV